ncbi:MAG TPA: Sua5/YciO/YrdC/YwlC family protein, partial [Coleofasciculaceae cyanobacterium]
MARQPQLDRWGYGCFTVFQQSFFSNLFLASARMNVGLQKRLCIAIQGAVQGVGFRPFVYRLATDLKLGGWINNSAQGVLIEVEGGQSQLEIFLQRIDREKPPRSMIQRLKSSWLEPVGYAAFEIRTSVGGEKTAIVLPDLATCAECLTEIFDPANRRYRYPFTNCTHCGPRFSILNDLPYDRSNTTMQLFEMCEQCQAEYDNPLDRRFHAQPNACPRCGPHLEVWDQQGQPLASADAALRLAADAIRQGQRVAIKGIGGFHFLVDARSPAAVQRLRQAKQRPAKPFALLYPSLEAIQADCQVSALEAQRLRSSAAPILLLKRHPSPHCSSLAPAVAPDQPNLGIMLPYTPLHHLLMQDLGFPVIATSGNLADEPICTDEHTAVDRLSADLFLVHDRPIA